MKSRGRQLASHKGWRIGAILAALVFGGAAAAPDLPVPPAAATTQRMADWIISSHDNRNLPFVVIDKANAAVFVFDGQGRLRGASRALIGLARGDDSIPGIGDRPLSSIRPEDRTTPAGRFVAALGHDTGNHDILWVDYTDAIALHRVVTSNPKEHRTQRLASASPADLNYNFPLLSFFSCTSPAVSHNRSKPRFPVPWSQKSWIPSWICPLRP